MKNVGPLYCTAKCKYVVLYFYIFFGKVVLLGLKTFNRFQSETVSEEPLFPKTSKNSTCIIFRGMCQLL